MPAVPSALHGARSHTRRGAPQLLIGRALQLNGSERSAMPFTEAGMKARERIFGPNSLLTAEAYDLYAKNTLAIGGPLEQALRYSEMATAAYEKQARRAGVGPRPGAPTGGCIMCCRSCALLRRQLAADHPACKMSRVLTDALRARKKLTTVAAPAASGRDDGHCAADAASSVSA